MVYEGEFATVDLRSDTLSKPTEEMRDAMRAAVVGDDVYREDPTVQLLEDRTAALLGKESGLFVPSGTMGNLIAIMVHCEQRGSELIVGDKSHTFLFEQGGAARVAGAQTVIVSNRPDGTFSLDELRSRIRVKPDVHEPYTNLIIVENTHNMCGGTVAPLGWIDDLCALARRFGVSLHMDGARLFNAVVSSGVAAERIVRDFHSVNICLSKSLGAPVGSVLVGSKTFIEKARRARKLLGGGMRQAGVLAAAGLVALDKMIDRLSDDHRRAHQIGKAILDAGSPNFKVELDSLQTNILMVYLRGGGFIARDVMARLRTVEASDAVKVSVLVSSRHSQAVRVVLYHDITDEDVRLAIRKFLIVIDEFDAKFLCESS